MNLLSKICTALIGILVVYALSCTQNPVESPVESPVSAVEDQYIVVFNDNIIDVSKVVSEINVEVIHMYDYVFKGFSAKLTPELYDSLMARPDIFLIEPDGIITTQEQIIPPGIDRVEADLNPFANIDGNDDRVDVDIAIMDTGIKEHPDLNVYQRFDFTNPPEGLDDLHGHGTHVAGTAAALDNDFGVVGVAPGARLWSLKVLNKNGSGSFSGVIAALDFVISNGEIDVINMSFGGTGYSEALHIAFQNTVATGVSIVVAAGNNRRSIYGSDNIAFTADDLVPAVFPEVMTVSAMIDTDGKPGGFGSSSPSGWGVDDAMASFSSHANSVDIDNFVFSPGGGIDISMPGADVLSICIGGFGDSYCKKSGTSMASPHAAGLTALFIAEFGRPVNAFEVYQIRQFIVGEAFPQSGWREDGRIFDKDDNHEGLGNAITDGTGSFPPSLRIISPIQDRLYNYAADILFDGIATDREDGDISNQIEWVDSINGLIGTGTNFFRKAGETFSVGRNKLTVSITDSDNNTKIVSLSFKITDSINIPPVLAPVGDRSTREGTFHGANISASDVDETPITLFVANMPSFATFVDKGDGTGKFLFSPSYVDAGSYTMTFIASDGLLADSETVVWTVTESNSWPVINPIGSIELKENENISIDITATDRDSVPNGYPTLAAFPLIGNMTFVDNGFGNGVFTFSPVVGQAGSYAVTFEATDAIHNIRRSEIVTITVFAEDDMASHFFLSELSSDLIDTGRNTSRKLLPNEEIEGDIVAYFLAPFGTVTNMYAFTESNVPNNANWEAGESIVRVYVTKSPHVSACSISVSISRVDSLGIVQETSSIAPYELNWIYHYPPQREHNFIIPFMTWSPGNEKDRIRVNYHFKILKDFNSNVTIQTGTKYAKVLTNVITFPTDSTDPPPPPPPPPDSNFTPILDSIGAKTINEGTNLNFIVTATDSNSTIPILTTSTLPNGATFVDNLNTSGTFDWTPTFTQSGVYNVTFYATDDSSAVDSEVVVITVINRNFSPVLDSIGAQQVFVNDTLNIEITTTNIDGDSLFFTTHGFIDNMNFIDNGDGTAFFTFMPVNEQIGIHDVSFVVRDLFGNQDAETVTITVLQDTIPPDTNLSPVLDSIGAKTVDEGINLSFIVSASDSESVPILTTSILPTGATFIDNNDGTGTFDWTPTFLQSESYNITFYATDDSSAVDSEVVVITVNNVNQVPVLAAIGAKFVDENINLSFDVSATDPDLDSITLTIVDIPTNAVFTDNGNGTGSFNWTPDSTQAGVYNVTFYAMDGIATDSEIVVITVNNVSDTNNPPILDSIGNKSATTQVNFNFNITASDADGTIPVLTVSPLPLGASFIDNTTGIGTFSWTPGFDRAGVYNITFYASDNMLVDSETIQITVSSCCIDIKGDVDGDGLDATYADLLYLTSYVLNFDNAPAPVCLEEADFNFDNVIDGDDASWLWSYLRPIDTTAPPLLLPTCSDITNSFMVPNFLDYLENNADYDGNGEIDKNELEIYFKNIFK